MSKLPAFEVSYDYLCPFAHIAHEHLVEALRTEPGWDVTFTPWTLRQVHKEEDAPDVWDDPAKRDDLLAMASSVVVRDKWPEQFLDVHLALFRARHDKGIRLSTRDEVASVLTDAGADAEAVLSVVDEGGPIEELATSWRRLVDEHAHFGVPTFVVGDEAAFVRLMQRPTSPADAVEVIEWILDALVNDTRLNEFKRTKIAR
jgi:protein-disulfide isomerase-like protein with CxxC motif